MVRAPKLGRPDCLWSFLSALLGAAIEVSSTCEGCIDHWLLMSTHDSETSIYN